MELCRFLRWKGFHGRVWSTAEELKAQHDQNHVPYTCLRTSQCWGPDEHPVAPEACRRQRACFEPSPQTPRSDRPESDRA